MQQDITRGRGMTDSLYQANSGQGGTHNAILSSEDYLSQARKDLSNIEDGFYIAPLFLDKLSIHIAKNFLDLPKIKVPLILGASPDLPSLSHALQGCLKRCSVLQSLRLTLLIWYPASASSAACVMASLQL